MIRVLASSRGDKKQVMVFLFRVASYVIPFRSNAGAVNRLLGLVLPGTS